MDDTRASGRGVHVGSATNQINWATEAPTLTIGEWTWSQEIKEEKWVEKTLGQWETVNRNEHSWIAGAIEKAAKKFPNFGLNLKLFHYRTSESEYNSIRI